MMGVLTQTFLRGLLFLLPIALSLYFLAWFFSSVERACRHLLLSIMPNMPYLPGMGIVVGTLVIFGVGLFLSSRRLARLAGAVELPFKNVPIVKSIYSALKDLTAYFSPKKGRDQGRVVMLKVPNLDMELVGFLTRDDFSALPPEMNRSGCVAVYLPMSYQIGGYTVFVPKEWVKEVNVGVEVAMRSALTAWMPNHQETDHENSDKM